MVRETPIVPDISTKPGGNSPGPMVSQGDSTGRQDDWDALRTRTPSIRVLNPDLRLRLVAWFHTRSDPPGTRHCRTPVFLCSVLFWHTAGGEGSGGLPRNDRSSSRAAGYTGALLRVESALEPGVGPLQWPEPPRALKAVAPRDRDWGTSGWRCTLSLCVV